MRTSDLLLLSLSALRRQKGRTVLTMSGVVIGTFALVLIVAIGQGFQAAVAQQFDRGNQLRQIMVNPGFGAEAAALDDDNSDVRVVGEMSDDKRRRIRKTVLSRRGMGGNPQQKRSVLLDDQRMRAIAAIPGVEKVTPMIQDRYHVILSGANPQPSSPTACKADCISIGSAAENARLSARIVAGRWYSSDTAREVVLHEYLLYRWGLTTDQQVASVVGQTLVVEHRGGAGGGPAGVNPLALATEFLGLSDPEKNTLTAMLARLRGQPANLLAALDKLELTEPERALLAKLVVKFGPVAQAAKMGAEATTLFREEFVIVGVIREFMEDDDVNIFEAGMSLHADLFLPIGTAEELYQRVPANRESGFASAIVTADSELSARQITRDIRTLGLVAVSMGVVIEKVKTALTIVTALVAFLGGVALLVAALGIINTMLMSVLERTREIGIMKAVGARDGQVQLLFFAESLWIGLLGGGLGVLLGWLIGFPAEAVGRAYISEKSAMPYKGPLLEYPWWLLVGAIGFAAVVSVAAAVWPARRAARINPIAALRHE